MSYQEYEEYKDSGVKYIDKIPEHWELIKLRMFAKIQPSNVDKKSLEDQETIHLCNYMDVYYHEYIDKDINFMKATASESQIFKFTLRKGDVIITKDSETPLDIAVPAYVPENLPGIICGYHLAIIRLKNEFTLGEYLFRAFQSEAISNQYSSFANGLTRYGIKVFSIGNALFPIPSLNEQKSIITFLKVRTSEIDALVADRKKMVELFREYRQALISEAVTNGLDQNVAMKGSEIECISKIPQHWKLRKLRMFAKIQPSNVDKKIRVGEATIQLCNYMDVYYHEYIDNDIEFMKATASDSQISKFTLRKGDIIITKDSETPLDIAVPAYVLNDLPGIICGYHLAMIRVQNEIVNGEYIFRAFQSEPISYQYSSFANGLTRYGLKIHSIGNALFPLPPLDEQKSIIEFLKKKTSEIDSLIIYIKNQIEKLEKYRQALISEAVTGKIDVRNHN